MKHHVAVIVSVVGIFSPLLAQDIPVRRAEPVAQDVGTSTAPPQGWDVRRAEPVSSPSVPDVRRAEPVTPRQVPTSSPSAPFRPSVSPAESDEEIRVAPAVSNFDPVAAVLEQANAYYARKIYDMAAKKYEEFLVLRPVGAERQSVLFRMGESLRAMERKAEASAAYQQVLTEFNTGDFIGPAAYRLGEAYYAARNFAASADAFGKAGQYMRDSKLRLASKYFEARSLEEIDRRMEALSAYREVVAQTEDNPYRDYALFQLAEGDSQAGLTDSAFRQFRKLAEAAQSKALRIGAAANAGLLAIDAKDYAAARPLLEQAAASHGEDEIKWKRIAQTGLVRLEYEMGNFEAAAQLATQVLPQLPAESRPKVLLIAANSQRQLERYAEALDLYDQLATEFSNSPQAREAAFYRLVALVSQKDERALSLIDEFLASSANASEKAKAYLLKAELLFTQSRFAEAAPLYEKALDAEGMDKYRSGALSKLAWCQYHEKKYDLAVATLTRFLTQFPRDPQVSTALAQRAKAQNETGQMVAALEDYAQIVNNHPEAREREDAMYQQAILLGKLQRPAEMAAAFQRLLAEYPQSNFAAEANFWIGYTAFDAKQYRDAIPALDAARKLDPKTFGERASLRVVMSYYYLEDRENASREALAWGPEKAPVEVRTWLGRSALAAGNFNQAVQFLRPLAEAPDASDELRASLVQAQVKAGDFDGARTTLKMLLPHLHEPRAKASAYLLMAEALLGQGAGEEAKAAAEEALKLQPEGRLNAEARWMNGRALLAQGRQEDAARAFMAVALLYDEKDLSPQALLGAEDAYRKVGNTVDADRARDERQRRYPDFQKTEAIQP